MAHSLVSQIAFAALFVVCAFAFIKGGASERWGAAVIGSGWLGGIVIAMALHGLFSPPALEMTLLAMDVAMAVGLLILAMRFAKMWLGVAMLLQSAELALHGVAMADWGFQFRQYIAFNNAVSFGLLMLLGGATVTAWVHRARKASESSATVSAETLGTSQAAS